MRKTLWFVSALLLSLSVAQAQKQTWNLSKDIQDTGNEISFSQGAKGVWYFLESSSTEHDPLTYRLMGHYGAPCDVNGKNGPFAVRGLACWSSVDVDPSRQDENRSPSVTFNFTDTTIYLSGYPNVGMPPKTVVVDPMLKKLGIIAWESPITGTIRISGFVTDLHAGGSDGVRWSIDKGDRTMLSGEIPDGGSQTFDLKDISTRQGKVIYFVIDALGDQNTDEIGTNLTIKQTK